MQNISLGSCPALLAHEGEEMASPVFIVVELCTSYVGANANPRNYQVGAERMTPAAGSRASAHTRASVPAAGRRVAAP